MKSPNWLQTLVVWRPRKFMLLISSTALGISLIVFGIICYVVVSQLLNIASRSKGTNTGSTPNTYPELLQDHTDAYILIDSRGRVLFINTTAKKWFDLNGKKDNLEVLASRIQPEESFLTLCSREGNARFKIKNRLVEGNSYPIPYESNYAMVISLRGIDSRGLVGEGSRNLQTNPPRFTKQFPDSVGNSSVNGERFSPEPMDCDQEFPLAEGDSWQLTRELEKRVEERTRQLKFEHQRAETLLRITTELSSSLDFEQILQRTLELLNEVIGASHATCMVLQPGNNKLRHLATVGYSSPVPQGGMPSILDTNQGLVGWIIANRKSVLIHDVLEDERWIELPLSWYQHRSAVGSPIMIGNQLLGVLLLYYPEVGHFSEEQLDLIQAAANQMAVAIKNA